MKRAAHPRIAVVVEVVRRVVAPSVLGERDRRTVFEAADDHRAGQFAVFAFEFEHVCDLLLAGLEAAHVLFEFAEHEEAAEGERVGHAGVVDQRQLERKPRVPARRARAGSFGIDVFLQHQRLAAAIDIAEILDAVAARVLQCATVLDVDDAAAAIFDEFPDLCGQCGGLALGFVGGQHHAVNVAPERRFPRGDGRVGECRDAGRGLHAAAKIGVGRRAGREAERLVAGKAQRQVHERPAAVALVARLEFFRVEQLPMGADEMEVRQVAQHAFRVFGHGPEFEEDVGSGLSAVAFEDVALQGLQQLELVRIGLLPGKRFGEMNRHDEISCEWGISV